MITKVLKPEAHGAIVYDNKGSSIRLVQYMEHEAREQDGQASFFNHEADGIAREVVFSHIDRNVKGLRKEDSKFYSLVVSPSQEELRHIASDEEKLKTFTRQVMENYAQNFRLKDDKSLHSRDLVWYAVIHHSRHYHGTDPEVVAGKARSGEEKRGEQTHVHIIVSRRDREQQISLTPNGSKSRFPIKAWQEKNAKDFQLMFGYEKKTHYARAEFKERKLRERVEQFIQKAGIDRNYFNPERVVFIAKEQQFDWKFSRNLKTLEKSLGEGLRPGNPYEGLSREDLLAAYQKQHGYRLETPQEKRTLSAITSLRYSFLKEHGFALSENELNLKEVLRVQQSHPQRWKFIQNLKELEAEIFQTGKMPENYLERLRRTATAEEQATRRLQPGRGGEKASRVASYANEGRGNTPGHHGELEKTASQKAEPLRNGQEVNVSVLSDQERSADREKPINRGGGKLGGLSDLFNSLARSASIGGREESWSATIKKHAKRKARQQSKDQGREL